jgi:H+/Cl- antiporter ClcA
MSSKNEGVARMFLRGSLRNLTLVAAFYGAYFAYVVLKHGSKYALSTDNVSWFAHNVPEGSMLAILAAFLSAVLSRCMAPKKR